MPLGNGQLGLAVWSAGGLTIQLNRADTLPGRLSPGQIVIPGLAKLTSASDYGGRLKLHDGEFAEHGNGMTATVYVQPAQDIAVVEVNGADPDTQQSVELHLWTPRHPEAHFGDNLAVLSETWKDTKAAGASGQTFGALAAVCVDGESPSALIADNLTVRVTFRPHTNGTFRVFIAAPHFAGGHALQIARSLLTRASALTANTHQLWWHNFWNKAAMFQMASSDGSAEYLENLRTLYLYMAAAEKGGPLPGSQAGIADLFSPLQDSHKWDPSAYWHFNLRMLVAANLGAGLADLNQPYFNLYRQNLQNIEHWTAAHMHLPGVCVPETMRFNGQGFENEDWIKTPGLNCDSASPPYYNARTLSTGAEVSLWIWNQYLATNDHTFLAANYPVMAASARFLLAYSKVGDDGKRHTFPTNAHENQWDVHDSTNDICAMRTLFPALIKAAKILGRDAPLAEQAKLALTQIPELPGSQTIAQSYTPDAEIHNTENVGLEPVWPYGLIGDSAGPQHDLGVRTYQARTNKLENDWSFDPLQAARLGLASEVKAGLLGLTEKYQAFPSGLASFIGNESYIEQIGVLTASLQEALAQDYDGLLRILPAWPKEWDVTGTVFIRHQSKVTVDFRSGSLAPVALESGFTGSMHVRNPWPGESVEIHNGTQLIPIHRNTNVLEFTVEKGHRYLLTLAGQDGSLSSRGSNSSPYAQGPRFLGTRSIGLGTAH